MPDDPFCGTAGPRIGRADEVQDPQALAASRRCGFARGRGDGRLGREIGVPRVAVIVGRSPPPAPLRIEQMNGWRRHPPAPGQTAAPPSAQRDEGSSRDDAGGGGPPHWSPKRGPAGRLDKLTSIRGRTLFPPGRERSSRRSITRPARARDLRTATVQGRPAPRAPRKACADRRSHPRPGHGRRRRGPPRTGRASHKPRRGCGSTARRGRCTSARTR